MNILRNGSKEVTHQLKDSFVISFQFKQFSNVEMKQAAHVHHKSVKQLRKDSVKNNYSIKYVASPVKSYLVNPKEGEIDYSQAYRNYDKFFDKVS